MRGIFLKRLSLLGCLSAVVVAILWNHIVPKIPVVWRRLIIFLRKKVALQEVDGNEDDWLFKPAIRHQQHPRSVGHILSRKTSDKQENPLHGYAKSGRPDRLDMSASQAKFPGSRQIVESSQQPYSVWLTIFSACVLTLIIYTFLKLLTGKLTSQQSANPIAKGYLSSQTKRDRNLGSADKRIRVRLSREERAKQLILMHGGKNVTTAIRIIASQLEEQKLRLGKSQSFESSHECTCACHEWPGQTRSQCGSSTDELVSNNSTHMDLDKSSSLLSGKDQDKQFECQ